MKYPPLRKPLSNVGNEFHSFPKVIVPDLKDLSNRLNIPNKRTGTNPDKILKWAITISIILVLCYAGYRLFFG